MTEHEQPDFEPDRTSEQAKDGDRTASLVMWGQIADGKFNSDAQYWLQHVAANLLDAESKDAGTLRDRAIVRALGLEGKIDKHRDLREFADLMKGFGGNRQELIEVLANPSELDVKHWPWRGLYRGRDPIDLAKLIDRELTKLLKPT